MRQRGRQLIVSPNFFIFPLFKVQALLMWQVWIFDRLLQVAEHLCFTLLSVLKSIEELSFQAFHFLYSLCFAMYLIGFHFLSVLVWLLYGLHELLPAFLQFFQCLLLLRLYFQLSHIVFLLLLHFKLSLQVKDHASLMLDFFSISLQLIKPALQLVFTQLLPLLAFL